MSMGKGQKDLSGIRDRNKYDALPLNLRRANISLDIPNTVNFFQIKYLFVGIIQTRWTFFQIKKKYLW